MREKIKYTDEPLGRLRRIPDFLPPPEVLAKARTHVKVTIALTYESLEYFRHEAEKNKTSYQKMIRELVDIYAAHYQEGKQR